MASVTSIDKKKRDNSGIITEIFPSDNSDSIIEICPSYHSNRII